MGEGRVRNRMSSSKNRPIDPVRKYGAQDPHNKSNFTCTFFGTVVKEGAYRHKQHLIGGFKDTKNSPEHLHEHDEYDDVDDEEVEIAPPKKSRQKGPMDMHYTPNPYETIKDRNRKAGKQQTINEVFLTYESFKVVVEAIRQLGPGMKPPSMYELRVPILKKEVENVKAEKGCSIYLMDGAIQWCKRTSSTFPMMIHNPNSVLREELDLQNPDSVLRGELELELELGFLQCIDVDHDLEPMENNIVGLDMEDGCRHPGGSTDPLFYQQPNSGIPDSNALNPELLIYTNDSTDSHFINDQVNDTQINETGIFQETKKSQEINQGFLFYEPPQFPSSDIPFFSCDLIQSGGELHHEYSPLGILHLMMTSSIICFSPCRLWDDSPEVVLKSAAKSFTSTPSILKKRNRDLMSPFFEKRTAKVEHLSEIVEENLDADLLFSPDRILSKLNTPKGPYTVSGKRNKGGTGSRFGACVQLQSCPSSAPIDDVVVENSGMIWVTLQVQESGLNPYPALPFFFTSIPPTLAPRSSSSLRSPAVSCFCPGEFPRSDDRSSLLLAKPPITASPLRAVEDIAAGSLCEN
ncbi:hypothetical protein LXL04_023519 [Taraxacum kok-saghyz]